MRTLLEEQLDEADLECLRYLETMSDDEIDCSEIPEVTDWTGWTRRIDGKPVDSPFDSKPVLPKANEAARFSSELGAL